MTAFLFPTDWTHMSGKLIKRLSAVLALSVLPVLGFSGVANASTTPGINAVAYIEHHDMGRPYVYGATGPWSFDCSGLIQSAFHAEGRYLPRTTDEQWGYLASKHKVSWTHQTAAHHTVQYGDILFFLKNGRVEHVGIYIGNNKMIDAPYPGQRVRVDNAFYNWGFSYITFGWVS